MVCSGGLPREAGSAWDSAHQLSVGVSPLTGCQWELLELEVKEQSLSGHTRFWGG